MTPSKMAWQTHDGDGHWFPNFLDKTCLHRASSNEVIECPKWYVIMRERKIKMLMVCVVEWSSDDVRMQINK